MAKTIGIDLGTTNCCISYIEGNQFKVIPSLEGSRVYPSMIGLSKKGERIFGNIAKRQFASNPKNTIWAVKRLIGRRYDSEEVTKFRKYVSFDIVEDDEGKSRIKLGGKIYSPEELSGFFLKFLRLRAEEYLNDNVENAVITVPAFFNDNQRQSTKVAGEIAGLKVKKILNEPTSALIAYQDKIAEDGIYAVYDLGGGTFDISIVEVKKDVRKVISTSGDTFLGGNDFDTIIVDWILQRIIEDIQVDLSESHEIMARIRKIAERVKIELSFEEKATISLPHLYSDNQNVYNFEREISRSLLEDLTSPLVYRTLNIVKEAFNEINVNPAKIKQVILVGGQSRMPMVSGVLKEYFDKEPYVELNPGEVVAMGAATQAEIISGELKSMILLDVTPLSLGVETKGDEFHKIIARNTSIPVRKSEIFSTTEDDQTSVRIHVLQGERKRASKNVSLGQFTLHNIEKAPKGIPKIEVSFSINANGIVKVTAKDKKTGKLRSIKVKPSAGLTAEEVEAVKKEARKYEEMDKKHVELKKVKDYLFEEFEAVQFFMNRYEGKISSGKKKEITIVLKMIKEMNQVNDIKVLRDCLHEISRVRKGLNELLVNQKAKDKK